VGFVREGRCSVLVALSPRMLEDSVAILVRLAGVDDVVTLTEAPGDHFHERYDAMITNVFADGVVHADVVIHLPDNDGPWRTTIVRESDTSHIIEIEQADDVLALLDRFCPTATARTAHAPRR
jgi:hypothetical protein